MTFQNFANHYSKRTYLTCVKETFRAIISDDFVLTLFQENICDLFIDGADSVLLNPLLINVKSPTLHNVIFLWDQRIPECFWRLFAAVATKARTYWNATKMKRDEADEKIEEELGSIPRPSAEHLALIADWKQSGSHYAAPYRRYRPKYDEDGKKAAEETVNGTCCKKFPKYLSKTGGIWIVRCIVHGICVGFHVVRTAEGLNDPFSSLYCHFLVEPSLTVMDFACKYISYCMRREPGFFRNGIKAIDEMHGTHSHVSCSNAARITVFKDSKLPMYSNLNDSSAEQRNVRVNKIKDSARYFRKEIFMTIVTLVLSADNRELIRSFLEFK